MNLKKKWEKCKIVPTATIEYVFTNCSDSILRNINIPPHTTALRTFCCNLSLLLLLVNTRPLKPNFLKWSGIVLMFIMELKLAHRTATSDPSQQTFRRRHQGPPTSCVQENQRFRLRKFCVQNFGRYMAKKIHVHRLNGELPSWVPIT